MKKAGYLTKHFIKTLVDGKANLVKGSPILQILEFKTLGNKDAYGIKVSDGVNWIWAAYRGNIPNIKQYDIIKISSYTFKKSTSGIPGMMIGNLPEFLYTDVEIAIGSALNIVGDSRNWEDKLEIDVNIPEMAVELKAVAQSAFFSIANAEPNEEVPPKSRHLVDNRVPDQNEERKEEIDPKPKGWRTLPTVANIDIKKLESSVIGISEMKAGNRSWTIKARVTKKGDVRTFKRRGQQEGKLLPIELIDAGQTEITATLFFEAITTFGKILEEGNVYYFSNGNVKHEKNQYSSIQNELRISFDRYSMIVLADDDNCIPLSKFNYTPISEIVSNPTGKSTYDIIGIVARTMKLDSLITTSGAVYNLPIILIDESLKPIEIKIWRDKWKNKDFHDNPIVAFKNLQAPKITVDKVQFSTRDMTTVIMSPGDSRELELNLWKSENKEKLMDASNPEFNSSMSVEHMGISEIKAEVEQLEDVTNRFYRTYGSIFIPEMNMDKLWYTACVKCKKKVIKRADENVARCENCNNSQANYYHNYAFTAIIDDGNDTIWVTFWGREAEYIINSSANEMAELRESDYPKFIATMRKTKYKEFLFGFRPKRDLRGYIKYMVCEVGPYNYSAVNTKLISNIKLLFAKARGKGEVKNDEMQDIPNVKGNIQSKEEERKE